MVVSDWVDPVAGPVRGAGVAPKFETTPGGVWRGAPWLGQDTRAILERWLGYPPAEVDQLLASGVLGEHPPARGPEPAPEPPHLGAA